MNEEELHSLLKETTDVMAAGDTNKAHAADGVLEKLQEAVKEHEKILHQQEMLIRQLREQLREVER